MSVTSPSRGSATIGRPVQWKAGRRTIARRGADRPLLLVGTDGFRDARFDPSWGAAQDHPGGRTER